MARLAASSLPTITRAAATPGSTSAPAGRPRSTTTPAPAAMSQGSASSMPATSGAHAAARRSGRIAVRARGAFKKTSAHDRASAACQTVGVRRLSGVDTARRVDIRSIPAHTSMATAAAAASEVTHDVGPGPPPRSASGEPTRRKPTPTASSARTASQGTLAPAPRPARTIAASTSAPRAQPTAVLASRTAVSRAASPGALQNTGSERATSTPRRRTPAGEATVVPPSQRGMMTAARPAEWRSARREPPSGRTMPASNSPIVRPPSSTGSRHQIHASATPGSAATARSPRRRSRNGTCARLPVHATGPPLSSTSTSASSARPAVADPRRSSLKAASGAASLPPASSTSSSSGLPASDSRRRWTCTISAPAACAHRAGASAAGTRPSIASAAAAIPAVARRTRPRRGQASARPRTTSGRRHSNEAGGKPGHGPAASPIASPARVGGTAAAAARAPRTAAALSGRRSNLRASGRVSRDEPRSR